MFNYLFFSLFLFLFIAEIPRFSILPISPVFLFFLCYIFFFLQKKRFAMGGHETFRIFYFLLAFWFYQYTVDIWVAGDLLDLQLFVLIGIFAALIAFIGNAPDRVIGVVRIVGAVLMISMVWFFVETVVGHPLDIRLSLYEAVLEKYQYTAPVVFTSTNGLASLTFLFGYHVAVAFPMHFMLFLTASTRKWKLLWFSALMFSIFALIFSAQRSAFLGAIVSLPWFFYKIRRIKLLFFLVFVGTAGYTMVSTMNETNVSRNLVAKFQDEGKTLEGKERLVLQWIGLRIAFDNPLGLLLSRKDWETESYEYGATYLEQGGTVIAVHNGYLGRIIGYGWAAGLLILGCSWQIFLLLKKGLVWDRNSVFRQYVFITGLSLISVLIHASFHNTSIFTFNPISLTMLFLFSHAVRVASLGTDAMVPDKTHG